MKKIIFFFAICQLAICNLQLKAQARLVLNNNGYINIENNAFLVIDNGAANAITLLGTGGNILSERETDLIKWNVSNNTGNHIVPWTNTNGVKVPVEFNITAAGNVGGSVLLSTYRTTNMNTPWPAVAPAVTNMCSPIIAADASLFVVDRFYRIDVNSYGTKPAATMIFGYDFINEAVGANTIIEANLQVQRYNPTAGSGNSACPNPPSGPGTGSWEGLLFGTVNTVADNVNTVAISSANWFKDWILVDRSTPLPITLSDFNVNCSEGNAVISWTTAAEINNDFFTIEKSNDAVNFYPIGQVQGAGNSNSILTYFFTDNNSTSGVAYYRLKQTDFDGQFEYFNIVATNCGNSNDFSVNQLLFTDNQLGFTISTSENEKFQVYLYDARGRLVTTATKNVVAGYNAIKLDDLKISTGIYMLSLIGEKNHYSTKVMK